MSSTVKIDTDSENDSDVESEDSLASGVSFIKKNADDIVLEEPMYYILSKFLMNDNDENIATILTNLTKEIVLLREAIVANKNN
jgi:hypothetical protein